MIVQFFHAILGNFQRRTKFGIFLIRIGDDGIEAIVAAGELNDDQDGILRPGLFGVRRRVALLARKAGRLEPNPRREPVLRKSRLNMASLVEWGSF